ncbi:SCP2 sterol-binding domain-containing protein [Actinocorallia sp. API 0066]|uniref:SCP2 sterol-binding domain-containing protein n=1 Tax=Actinocorallia sp. API 0066 TaxID=2896846 RepID=UPI001E3C9B29|nr:SCP2 sterol-binding domain-containing protein [Actinocorallia sp. API 0066]MCD0453343.1 SCP2 sterol-binding domain-containing protein [Actinocorallia sp. API 0066]
MSRRTYDQYCGLARALDVVGERWTLLIVRELIPGPKRYSDLARHHMRAARGPAEEFRAGWSVGILSRLLDSRALDGLDGRYLFHIDDDTVLLRLEDGTATVQEAPQPEDGPVDASLTLGSDTMAAIAGGNLPISDAVLTGRVHAEGDPAHLHRLTEILNGALRALATRRTGD